MFYRRKPKIIFTQVDTQFGDLTSPDIEIGEYEPVKLVDCPKRPEKFGDCPGWQEGRGSQQCCSCTFAIWDPPVIKI